MFKSPYKSRGGGSSNSGYGSQRGNPSKFAVKGAFIDGQWLCEYTYDSSKSQIAAK
jgi:hypothetical protein